MANHEIARLETKGQKLQLGAGQDRGHSTARPVRAVGITLLMGYFLAPKESPSSMCRGVGQQPKAWGMLDFGCGGKHPKWLCVESWGPKLLR